jgi:hypothetical protein
MTLLGNWLATRVLVKYEKYFANNVQNVSTYSRVYTVSVEFNHPISLISLGITKPSADTSITTCKCQSYSPTASHSKTTGNTVQNGVTKWNYTRVSLSVCTNNEVLRYWHKGVSIVVIGTFLGPHYLYVLGHFIGTRKWPGPRRRPRESGLARLLGQIWTKSTFLKNWFV